MEDRSFIKKPHRELVRQEQGREVAVADAIRTVPLGFASKVFSPASIRVASRHSVKLCGRAMAVIGVVALCLVGGLYARLLGGPISFAFLVPSLQTQLNSQIKGYRFKVGDAILRLSRGWGLEFRLADVALLDNAGQELAKAPFAAVDVSEPSLLKLSLAASSINLIGPKVLLFNRPGEGLALTGAASMTALAAPAAVSQQAPGAVASAAAASSWQAEAQAATLTAGDGRPAPASIMPFNPAPLLNRLFTALDKRGGASSALQRIELQDAVIYFASDTGLSTWHLADFHVDLDESGDASALKGELVLRHDNTTWRAAFRAVNEPQNKRYSVTASIQDVVPRSIWESVPSIAPLKLVDLPISGEARFDISHDGELLGGGAEIKLGSGQFFAPFDEKHPAIIDSGLLKVSYDKANESLMIKPFELRWDDSILTISGAVSQSRNKDTGRMIWAANLDGSGTQLGAPQFGAPTVPLEAFKLSASYDTGSDGILLNDFRVRGAGGEIAIRGQAAAVSSGGPISVQGSVSPMPLSFLKVIWPAFVANGARDWIGSNVPAGGIAGGAFRVNLSAAVLKALDKDGDVPDDAVSMRLDLQGLQIYHIKGLPPILTKATQARVTGRRFVFDIPNDTHIEVPSGRSISFSDAQFIVDDLRPHFPNAEVHFKGAGEVASVMELLDQPPLGYVKAVGFKPNLVNGQATTTFKITFPLLKELKFKQLGLSGRSRVTDLKSNGLPGGIVVNGGTVTFDVSEAAIGANGDLRVNNVPVTLVWQRIFDAPPEKQPTLRVAGILNEKARDELGLNINHIVKGDLPIALAVAMQRDGPPKLFMEANLTNTDIYLTAIGWRKPPGQKASVSFDLMQRQDNFLVLDNFAMTGDGININGRLLFNDKRRIAGFTFPEFSTNALTKLAINGELAPQNILKVQARGPSFDGRQFFKSLLSTGKPSEGAPPSMKDEPGLDLNVEIETVFGFYDATVKSVVIDAKRRGGKIAAMEIAGRINGEAPVAVHIEQRGEARILVSDATDAGSAFRLIGFYPAVHGGTMNLRVNLDGSAGTEKTGTLDVRKFLVSGDQVLGKVVSQAEKEGGALKTDGKSVARQVSSGEPLQFDRLMVPFAVGAGQFQLRDAAINGPALGATLKGRIDFGRDTLALSGTYVPLYGFNAAFNGLPLIGDILNGNRNEGIFGITFAIQGRTSNPDVIVNPVSMLAPGFLRGIFEFDNNPPEQAPQARNQARASRPGASSNF